MPVTGNLQKDPEGLGESERQFAPVDNAEVSEPVQVSDCVVNEVSSTTIDPDPTFETELMHAEDAEAVQETVQSTTNVEMSSDSLDGLKDAESPSKESASKMSNNVASSTQFSKGFQDAFAAFASASFREDDEDAPADTKSVIDSKNEAVAAVAADSADAVAVEPLVTSAIDSGMVTTTDEESYVTQGQGSETALVAGIDQVVDEQMTTYQETETQSFVSPDQTQMPEPVAEPQPETTSASDSVYFIQTTDATGQIVTSIIDPNDIPAYADSIVYKQCMLPDGDIETTIVSQGGVPVTQEEQPQEQAAAPQEIEQVEPQIIYVHDANGQLTPIDSVQSANDVAPPGKQFVYMQDSTGRIIRTIMDANQTMVPGQQVYYTQSEDGRIITSVMDSTTAGVAEEGAQQAADQLYHQQAEQVYHGQDEAQQQTTALVGATAGFNIDNSMSGLSMLAELSHLTAGQATESRTASSTESNSMDMDEFRPVAMVTRRVGEEDAGLKAGLEDSVISKLLAEMKVDQTPSYTVSRDNLFVQWQNLDAMCWMDVVLIMLVYSPTLRPLVNLDPTHELASTLLVTLLKANRQAQVLLQNLLKKSNGAEISGLQTGAGNTASLQDPKTSKLVCKENMDEIGKAINILYAMREKIWQALQPRLRCERGKHNSPVLVLPLLVREKPAIKQMFTMNYRYVFKCEVCGYSQDDAHTKILPSIPAVPADFNMTTPSFVRNCFECQAPNQRMLMKFEGLQDFVQMHFVKGLPHNRFEELSFDFNDDHFEVTAVVHYKNNPDHFIAWVRNAPGNTWMECDDLKSVITRYQHVSPNIPPSQVHMVLWERRLTAQHTLVMRDTEDTKLLASLVLTVQQPNTHQTTDPAARATGAPSTQVPMYNTPQTNSLLSGLGAQNQALSTFSTRGRGRGRGNRGSYGRGRAAPSTMLMPVRRAPPAAAVPQLSSPTTTTLRARATTQTIRVPISSLPGAVRTMNVGGDKIVLLSNNASGGATAGSTSKVVVVRSQGGSSNITAAQILQLLQRTGAISGGRVTTTINSSSSSAPSSQSYIIQPDGSVVDAPSEAETSVQQAPAETDPTANEQPVETTMEAPMETGAEREEHAGEETGQEVPQSEHQISTLPFTSATPGRDQLSRNETIIVSPENASPSEATEESDQVAGVKAVLGPSQQQLPRYIQIPNPSGTGNILTQLTMRGGKMVLIPVNKNTQAQLTSTSILKLPNSPSGSPKLAIRSANHQIVSASSAGALLSQLQQQQNQMSSGSASTVSTIGGQKVITIPGSSGQKKTIQVITVPSSQKLSGQQGASPGAHSPEGSRLLSQSGNIVLRELKKEGDVSSMLSTSLASSSQLGSSPAVSLLKDVTARSGQSAASQQQKNQDSFRYILQGSSTTHILHTGASAAQNTVGRTFTALSSSGTIIGGQLTPSPTTSASGTSPMDQDVGTADEDSEHSLTPHRRLSREMDTTEYIPLGRGRAKTRGGRGRGRGGRTPRGRGRSQLWSTNTDYIPPQHPPSRKISTLTADLRQIGAHVIESSVEDVDGVPVVSIPDFTGSEEANHHADALSVPETLEQVHADQSADSTLSALSELAAQISSGESQEHQLADATSLSPQGPRVITQAIPSIKANHGFDILTQGILAQSLLAQPKQARSLLTGSPVTIPAGISSASAVSSTTILDASEMISTVSKLPQALSLAQASRSSEIDTLTEAALTAAKPGSPARSALVSPVHAPSKSPISTLSMDAQSLVSPLQQVADYPAADTFADRVEEQQAEEMELTYEGKPSQEETIERDERVVSVDESQVSAAERYRMPMELFQPDEESPEKPIKCAAATDFPAKLFQDSEVSSQEEEMSLSPKGAARHKTIKEIELDKKASLEASGGVSAKTLTHKTASKAKFTIDNDSSFGDDVDIETTEKMAAKTKKAKQPVSTGVKKRGRKKLKADVVEFGTEGSLSSKSPVEESIAQAVPSPPKLKPKYANIGGFATDVLMESELEEKAKVNDAAVNEECDNEASPEPMKSGEDNVQSGEEVDDLIPQVVASIVEEVKVKEVEKTVCKEAEKVLKRKALRPAAFVRHPKFKVDWCDAEEGLIKPRSFNYRVLLGKFKTSHHRHPSLARLQDDYTSPPSPVFHVFKEKPVVHRPPIVIRRIPKSLQSPAVDPSKEPTVIPLVAEDEGDPAYTGGSVVTSPIDGEIFNGVIVKKKTEMADWSSCLEEGEDEECLGEAKPACLEYCEHLLTEYYIAAVSSGDYTYLESCDEDEDRVGSPVDELVAQEEEIFNAEENLNEEDKAVEEETPVDEEKPIEEETHIEEKKTIVEETHIEEEKPIVEETHVEEEKSNCEQDLNPSVLESPSLGTESQIVSPTRPSFDSPIVVAGFGSAPVKKKRGRPSQTCPSFDSPSVVAGSCSAPVKKKRGRPKREPLIKLETVSHPKALVDVPSSGRVNGMDTVSSPAQAVSTPDLSQGQGDAVASLSPAASGSNISQAQKELALQSAAAFPSPSRRSGRTPIPSKRVLDAMEDSPLRAAFIGRRTSMVSSDDEHSGYSTGESVTKKSKKNVLTPS